MTKGAVELADLPESVRLMLYSGAIVAGTGASAALVLYVAGCRKLFFPAKETRGRWNGVSICIALFVAFFGQFLLQGAMSKFGFYHLVYGENSVVANPPDPDRVPNMDEEQKKLFSSVSNIRSLWSAAFSFPFQAAILLYLRRQTIPRTIPSAEIGRFEFRFRVSDLVDRDADGLLDFRVREFHAPIADRFPAHETPVDANG